MFLARGFVFAACIIVAVAPPPRNRDEKEEKQDDVKNVGENELYDQLELEYNRYLQEVVQALEGDEKFRKMLESVKPEDIKSGKIAQSLDLVSMNVRSKLDEIKRTEVERLRQLAMLEHERASGVGSPRIRVPGHVDYIRPDKFGHEDLKKLMQQTHKDLEEADKKRKEDFKKYEMEKQYKFQKELEKLPEEEKAKLKEKHEQELKKHKDHPKVHHPGSKQQLEEVWEKQDHLDPQDFDPRTLFYMHDLDGNGYLDQEEVKLLFRNEIRKTYDPDAPEDDMREMEEDLERMREHVFGESDTNRDGLISYDEFMAMVKRPDFEQDPEWHGVDDEENFSSQEFMEYERMRQEELGRMQAAGHLPPPPPGMHGPPPHEYYGYQAPPMPPQGHPGGYPQAPNVPHQGQVHPGQYAPHGGHPQGYQQPPQQVPQQYAQQQPVQHQQEQRVQHPQQGAYPHSEQHPAQSQQHPAQSQQPVAQQQGHQQQVHQQQQAPVRAVPQQQPVNPVPPSVNPVPNQGGAQQGEQQQSHQ